MSNCNEAVLRYLVAQNRPYSATDVMQNMHKEFGKTAIQKALDQLAEQSRILEKTYGKQKVYCALQQAAASRDEMAKEMETIDASTAHTADTLRSVEQQVRDSDGLLKDLESAPTTDEAEREVAALEARVTRLRDKLADLSQNCVKVSPEERQKTSKDHDNFLREFRKRKRICNDILNSILEGYPKPKKTLLEEVGIETDENAGVNLK